MKKRIFAVMGIAIIALGTYLFVINDENNRPQKGDTQNIKELVQDYSVENIKNQSASITSQELIVTRNDESQTIYELPQDEFFVSIAPYVNETHP